MRERTEVLTAEALEAVVDDLEVLLGTVRRRLAIVVSARERGAAGSRDERDDRIFKWQVAEETVADLIAQVRLEVKEFEVGVVRDEHGWLDRLAAGYDLVGSPHSGLREIPEGEPFAGVWEVGPVTG